MVRTERNVKSHCILPEPIHLNSKTFRPYNRPFNWSTRHLMYVSFEYSFRNRHICLTSLAVHLKHTLKYPFAASNLSFLKRPVESL